MVNSDDSHVDSALVKCFASRCRQIVYSNIIIFFAERRVVYVEIIIILIIFIMKVMNNSHELFQIADKYTNLLNRSI